MQETATDSETIHFGTIGVKIDDRIVFKEYGLEVFVASGDGSPSNGGRLVRFQTEADLQKHFEAGALEALGAEALHTLYDLPYATRLLLKDRWDPRMDVFELWTSNGRSLRSLYEEKRARE